MSRVQTKLIIKEGVDRIKVISDKNRLKQILLNFVSNAFKFTLNGFIKIKAKLMPKDHMVEISVKDSGLGIREENHNLVFQDFTQFNINNEEFNSIGSGLGTSICKNICEKLNHKIGFNSKHGKGSKFYIRIGYFESHKSSRNNKSICNGEKGLKLSQVEKMNINSNRSEIMIMKKDLSGFLKNNINQNDDHRVNYELENSKLTLTKRLDFSKEQDIDIIIINESKRWCKSSKRVSSFREAAESNGKSIIVIVDDHYLLRENTINLVRSVLLSLNQLSDFNIIEGSDGIELLNIIRLDRDNKIKCIFIDENMEYLNGSETVGIIRKLEQAEKIKRNFIVSVSGYDDEYSKTKLKNSGVDEVISKPCSKSDLKNILSQLK